LKIRQNVLYNNYVKIYFLQKTKVISKIFSGFTVLLWQMDLCNCTLKRNKRITMRLLPQGTYYITIIFTIASHRTTVTLFFLINIFLFEVFRLFWTFKMFFKYTFGITSIKKNIHTLFISSTHAVLSLVN